MNSQPATRTAAQLAAIIGRSRQAMQQTLATIPPSATVIVRGVPAPAWSFAALPVALQSTLAALAGQRGFRDAHALIAAADAPWRPRVPLAQAAPAAVDKAAKLRAVLLPFLVAKDAETRRQAQFEADGIAAYEKVFGHHVSGYWFRTLFKRTLDRAGAAPDFHRLEIYLDENAAPALKSQNENHGSQFDHSALAHRLTFPDPAHPTLTERQNALEYSFVHFTELAAAAPGQRAAIKRSILRFLFSAAPSLAHSAEALKRNWNRKFDRWKTHGQTPEAIADRRALKPAGAHLAQLQPDLDLIVAEAWRHDGKLALAVRKLRREGKLSQAFTDRYTLDVRRDKSYVARSIRDEITAQLTGLLAFRRSKWEVDMQGPRLTRSHDYAPGDFFAADDVTWNIYAWDYDDTGRPFPVRAECLLFFDCRSLYPLGYVLAPGKYNGETVRRGILNVHDKHGLPHRAYVFEKGVWESRLIVGERPRDFLGWDEYEMGLRQRGFKIEVRNVTTPGAKLIEGIFNILQQNQRNEPGFVGFCEKDYGQEELQKFKERCKRGLAHPREKFYSMDEWRAALDRSLEAYMREPQNGQLLQGKSPAEMFASHQRLRRLPEDARFLLSTHRVRAKVKTNGLGITIRGQRRFFYSKELGAFTGREVFAWFNLEQPDLLTVSDLDMKKFLSIQRQVLPAFDATKEQLAEAHAARRGFMQSAKLRFDQIQHPARRAIVRDDILDENAQALGGHIARQSEQFEAAQSERDRQLRRLDTAAAESGVGLPAHIRNPERALRGLELLNQSAAEIAQEQNGGADLVPPPTGKTYVLHDVPAARPTAGQYWTLWAKVEKIKPGLSRHTLTQKALGCHPNVKQMTEAQLRKMTEVFSAIIRDAAIPTP